MTPSDFLFLAAAVAGILSVIIQLAEFIIGSRISGATKWFVATGILLTVFALAGLAYLATYPGPSPIPPLNMEIRELQIDDTKD
jgi:hypothetical protein